MLLVTARPNIVVTFVKTKGNFPLNNALSAFTFTHLRIHGARRFHAQGFGTLDVLGAADHPCDADFGMQARVRDIEVVRLGRIRYADAMALMEARAEARLAKTAPDTLFLLEHDAVLTLGRRADTTHILAAPDELAARGIEQFETGRGGDVTYHGPGQIVAYPVLDLRPDRQDVRRYVGDLEETMIRAVARFGITAGRVDKLNGTWVGGERKIGAVGVRIARWITTHGFALNVSTDLDQFQAVIVPCGIQGKAVTSISKEIGREVTMDEGLAAVEAAFLDVFTS